MLELHLTSIMEYHVNVKVKVLYGLKSASTAFSKILYGEEIRPNLGVYPWLCQ